MVRIPIEEFSFPKCDDIDVINAWQWMMSFISDREWQRRKAEIEKELVAEFRTTVPFSEPLTDGTLLVIKKDVISWYLYLIDALINEPYKSSLYSKKDSVIFVNILFLFSWLIFITTKLVSFIFSFFSF